MREFNWRVRLLAKLNTIKRNLVASRSIKLVTKYEDFICFIALLSPKLRKLDAHGKVRRTVIHLFIN